MKKILFIGFLALVAAACGGAATTESTENTNKEEPKKEEPKKEELKGTAQRLLGAWQLTKVGNEELSENEMKMVITFMEGGVAKTEGGNNSEVKWQVKERDGKEYLVITSDKEEESLIKSIDDKTLTLEDKGEEIVLTKK